MKGQILGAEIDRHFNLPFIRKTDSGHLLVTMCEGPWDLGFTDPLSAIDLRFKNGYHFIRTVLKDLTFGTTRASSILVDLILPLIKEFILQTDVSKINSKVEVPLPLGIDLETSVLNLRFQETIHDVFHPEMTGVYIVPWFI